MTFYNNNSLVQENANQRMHLTYVKICESTDVTLHLKLKAAQITLTSSTAFNAFECTVTSSHIKC